ncbi:glycoside hydrolase family 97 protein [Saccharothrix texasensis]|uniref:Alpha-glucosidase n=1 Tax=Saccharothrix texasensis TaxID=103734 RepID=A0A3N1GX89_9PSEU|nr:glycoside hydrolase family 97 protein [Saccharothrix texasensis]ROP34837.1 alpha-glucosidase [Saccharothrix texasensis]
MSRRLRALGAVALASAVIGGLVGVAQAAPGSWTSVQPGATAGGCDGVRATVALDAAGSLTLGATWECRVALLPAPVGVVTAAADFTSGLTFVQRVDTPVSSSYSVVAGKSKNRARTATETRLVFAKGADRVTVVVRTARDGVALRYELPGSATVLREATSFEVPGDAVVSLAPFGVNHESNFVTSTAAAVGDGEYDLSVFAQHPNGSQVLLAESGVDGGYSGGRLTHARGTGRFAVKLADAQVARTGAFATAWRTAAIGTTATVVESTLVDDVAPPSKVADTSWVRPGVAAWPWLDGFHDTQRNLPKLKQWADYASAQGWPYLLVDDGWKGVTWMPELVEHARARGVRVMLWYHWTDLDTEAERDAEFTRITGWGVAGVKMDFMDSETRARHQWYDAALASTARYRLMVDLHGSRLPVGVHRTWPHVLTTEDVRGEEYPGGRTIDHVAAIPFTRGALGPADYSPMSFQQGNPNSDAAELALGVLYESGIMLPGGRVSDYQARPEAQRWMRLLPTTWDETRYVSGDPATGAVVARRDGDRWFVGALRKGTAGTISYPTAFLGSGTWHAEITTDGPAGLVRTSRVVQAGEALSVASVANGGHVVKLTRAATAPTGARVLANTGTGFVVDVYDAGVADDVPVIGWTGNGGTNQRFTLSPLGDGYVRVVNQNSGKDIVVQGASRDAGAKVIQYSYEPGANTNDEWLLEDAGDGRHRLANRFSGLYLTMPATQGAQLEQRPYDGSDRQTFTVT